MKRRDKKHWAVEPLTDSPQGPEPSGRHGDGDITNPP